MLIYSIHTVQFHKGFTADRKQWRKHTQKCENKDEERETDRQTGRAIEISHTSFRIVTITIAWL